MDPKLPPLENTKNSKNTLGEKKIATTGKGVNQMSFQN